VIPLRYWTESATVT